MQMKPTVFINHTITKWMHHRLKDCIRQWQCVKSNLQKTIAIYIIQYTLFIMHGTKKKKKNPILAFKSNTALTPVSLYVLQISITHCQ